MSVAGRPIVINRPASFTGAVSFIGAAVKVDDAAMFGDKRPCDFVGAPLALEEGAGPEAASNDKRPDPVRNIEKPVNLFDVGRLFQQDRRVHVCGEHKPNLPALNTTELRKVGSYPGVNFNALNDLPALLIRPTPKSSCRRARAS